MKLEQLFQHRSNKKAFRRNNLFSMLQQLFYFRADSYYFLSELWYPCQPARFSQKKKKKPAREFPGSRRRTCPAHRRSGVDGGHAASRRVRADRWRRPLTGRRHRRQVTAQTTRRLLMNVPIPMHPGSKLRSYLVRFVFYIFVFLKKFKI